MTWKPAKKPSRLPQWLPGFLHRPLGWIIRCCLIGIAIILAVVIFYFYLSLKYDLAELAKIPERSVILDRHHREFATIHGERRRLITRQEIPEIMVRALYAREDLRFPQHHGIDVRGLARATVRNLKDMSFTQGASTLTMQLARNSYNLRAKSLHRKLLEIAITLRIESHFSKDDIITHYLNRIYFGSGCHGVEEAAQTYFGRTAAELNTAECAILTGIIRGPHLFSPFRNIEGALAQRDQVLTRMVECGLLTQNESDNAKSEPIRLVPEKERHKHSSYVKESIRRQLNTLLDQHDIRDGGLRIFTTLDTEMQQTCEKEISKKIPGIELDATSTLQAAIVQINPKTGAILALSGGRSFQESSYNRAHLAKRDLGPAFTPFLNTLALERGKITIPGHPVQTGRQLGVVETTRLCKRLGFAGPFQTTEDLYRGSLAVSPLELSIATSIISNNGKKPDPFFIHKITNEQNQTLYEYLPETTQAITPNAAAETLTQITAQGQVTTTNPCRDIWGVRISPACVTVLWLGHDQPQKIGDPEKSKQAAQQILSLLKKPLHAPPPRG